MIRALIVGCLVGLFSSLAHAAPPCVPAVYGEQIGDIFGKRTNEGRYLHHYCKDGDKVVPVGFACVHGTCLPVGTFFENLDGYKQAADPVAAVKAAWDKAFLPDSCEKATGKLKIVCDDMYRSMRANWPVPATPAPPAPPEVVWKVKSNGLLTTRPAYLLTNGVRGTKEVARAAVGTVCDATKPTLASGSDLWAEFGMSGIVALCAKAP